jgi:hypothetical protein
MNDLLSVQKELVRFPYLMQLIYLPGIRVLTRVPGRGCIVLEHPVRAVRRDWQSAGSSRASTGVACAVLGRVRYLYREALRCLSSSIGRSGGFGEARHGMQIFLHWESGVEVCDVLI